MSAQVCVFLPAGVHEIEEKWKLSSYISVAAELQDMFPEVTFGFEVKGRYDSQGIETLGERMPTDHWGIHLPNSYSIDWSGDSMDTIELAEALGRCCEGTNPPKYVVIHGNPVEVGRQIDPGDTDSFRFMSDPSLHGEAYQKLVDIVLELMKFGLPVRLENVSITNFFRAGGQFIADTYLDLRIGSHATELLTVAERTNCSIVVDIEHLVFTITALAEHGCVGNRIQEGAIKVNNSDFWLGYGSPIGIESVPTVQHEISMIDTDVYHISGGGFYTREWRKVDGEPLIASHSPIYHDEASVMEAIRFILNLRAGRPTTFVLECSGGASVGWTRRPKRTQEVSFANFCRMLLQILQEGE